MSSFPFYQYHTRSEHATPTPAAHELKAMRNTRALSRAVLEPVNGPLPHARLQINSDQSRVFHQHHAYQSQAIFSHIITLKFARTHLSLSHKLQYGKTGSKQQHSSIISTALDLRSENAP